MYVHSILHMLRLQRHDESTARAPGSPRSGWRVSQITTGMGAAYNHFQISSLPLSPAFPLHLPEPIGERTSGAMVGRSAPEGTVAVEAKASWLRRIKNKKTNRTGHHTRPRRTAATAPLRTGAVTVVAISLFSGANVKVPSVTVPRCLGTVRAM